MATYPTSPNLPAVTLTTEVDPDFLNTFTDNINAMADSLINLVGGTDDGNIDLDAAKGIKWGSALKIYFSGGDIIIDDGVVISGSLDVGGTITADTITDSGAGAITVSQDMVFAAGKSIDAPTGKFDIIDDSGAAIISVLEDMQLSAGKYIDAPTGKFDVIDDSGAAQIIINETLEMASGKGLQGTGGSAIGINAGMNITGTLDVSNTLRVDSIDDSGAVAITILEDVELAAGKYIDAPTGKFDIIDDSGAGTISINSNVDIAGDLDIGAHTLTVQDFVIWGGAPNYTVAAGSTDRSFNAATILHAELAFVVGTIVQDLINLGIFQ